MEELSGAEALLESGHSEARDFEAHPGALPAFSEAFSTLAFPGIARAVLGATFAVAPVASAVAALPAALRYLAAAVPALAAAVSA